MTDGYAFDLGFGTSADRTFLGHQYVRYPVHVGRGLYTDRLHAGRCSVFLQSVSGGLFEHDVVNGRVAVARGAHAHVATPASTVIHAMRGGCAATAVELDAATGARIEYLPAPQILFPGSHLRSRTIVRLAEAATVIVGETFLAHDPAAAGGAFCAMDSTFEVTGSDHRLLARDRQLIRGADWLDGCTGIAGGLTVQGSLWILTRRACTDLLAALRRIDGAGIHAGASMLPAGVGLVFRVLGADAPSVARAMAAALFDARAHVLTPD